MTYPNSNRSTIYIFVAGLWLLFFLMSPAAALEYTMTYTFDRPIVERVYIEDTPYARIIMPDVTNGGMTGHPSLPARGAQILVPYAQEIVNIRVLAADTLSIGSGVRVEPVAAPVPYSLRESIMQVPQCDPAVYAGDDLYPRDIVKEIGEQRFRGYRILILKLHPVRYIPSTGELFYYPRLDVVVETRPATTPAELYRGTLEDEAAVMTRVDNADALFSYRAKSSPTTQSCEMIILTLPWLVDAFQPLKDYHNAHGLATEIYTVNDVLTEVGNDFPADIREFIRQKYLSDGIQYVLLGDDNDIIKAPLLYVEIPPKSPDDPPTVEPAMPSDFYYGCLDGPFDYDGDGLWGEPNDGEGGGDIDMTAEVYVGRASVDNSLEAARFVEKTIRYLSSDDSYLRKMLLCGEKTFFPGLMKFGKQSLVELIDGTDLHGYTTVGIPSGLYDIDGLYDMDGTWEPEELMALINDGYQVVNHLGHCHYQVALRLWFYHLDQLVNDDLCLIYSCGCFAGGFDTLDCWAEYITTKIDAGAFAAVMNARYGLGSYDDSDSPSHRLNREFWDAVFNPAEDKPTLGMANQDSKEDNYYRIDEPGMRWVMYELNLFGDPAVPIKRFKGLTFMYPDGVPTTVPVDQASSFRVDIGGLYGGAPAPGSGRLHYSISGGPADSTPMIELAAGQYEARFPPVACGDTIRFWVSADELSGERLYNPPPGSVHSAIPVLREIVLFEDDFETDKGWTMSGGWQRGLPSGSGGECGWPDPASGYNGPNIIGYNLDGDYIDSMPAEHVTSPAINCTYMRDVHLEFRRWLDVGYPPGDSAVVSVSTDGIDWKVIWANPGQMLDSTWNRVNLDVTGLAANESTVYFRWTMGPTDNLDSYCGWNIDDVRVAGYDCRGYFDGDVNADNIVNVGDVVYLINCIFKGGPDPVPPISGDANCDGIVNVGDAVFLINFIFKGGSMPYCP